MANEIKKLEGKEKMELARWNASSERNPVRLIELPAKLQDYIKILYGLPEKVNPAFVIGLGGKPYIEHPGLWDLLHKEYTVLEAWPVGRPEFVPCKEMGCVSRVHKGWKTEDGEVYESVDQIPKGKKYYKNYLETPPKDHEKMCIVRYHIKIRRQDGTEAVFESEGEACPHNCTSVTRDALRRMAETRAINRCLRPAVRFAGTTYEELPFVQLNGGERAAKEEAHLSDGQAPMPEAPTPKPSGEAPITRPQIAKLQMLWERMGSEFNVDEATVRQICNEYLGVNVSSRKELTKKQVSDLIDWLEKVLTLEKEALDKYTDIINRLGEQPHLFDNAQE